MSSPCGLVRFDGTGSRVFGAREGLPGIDTSGLAEDRAGNLWVGVKGAGVVRIVRDRVTAWSLRDGLAKPNVLQIVPRTGGGVAVVAEDETGVQVQELTGESFRNSTPPVRMLYPANHPALVDRSGDSWVATQGGVVRFRGGRRIHVYGATEGWPVGSETALYEDRAGDIWILHWGSPSYIGRWKRREKRVESLGAGGPADGDPFVLTEDAGGSIWVGCLRTGLFRWRAGTFVHVPSPFPPAGRFEIYSLCVDPSGRIWVGYTQGGFAEVLEPNGLQPHLRRIDLAGNFPPSVITALASDAKGHLYLGAADGLYWFDPASGRWASYADVYPTLAGPINSAARASNGDLWFGTPHGLVRLSPSGSLFAASPQTRLTQVRLNDSLYPLSDWGEQSVRAPRFANWQNRLEFSFSGLSQLSRLHYRYRLEPHDSKWSEATPLRTVVYPGLPPGSYRFAVQAVGPAGDAGGPEASFGFEIAAPFWRQLWFVALCALVLAGLLTQAYRVRVRNLLSVERLRTRIATDLHDDIGSSLSQIAVLSEVIRRGGPERTDWGPKLGRIAEVARQATATMSEIIWAINPRGDSLGGLVTRMRRFGNDLFASGDIKFELSAPEENKVLPLDLDLRRQLFLIYKEALHNIFRHAGSSEVSVGLRVEAGWLLLEIRDNGTGFDPAHAIHGHGLHSMRARASRVGAELDIETAPGQGTRLVLRSRLVRSPHLPA